MKRGISGVPVRVPGLGGYASKLRGRPAKQVTPRSCRICLFAIVREDALYCPVCGGKSLQRGRMAEMLYKKIRLDENSKAVVCPHCDNEEITPGDYCVICGQDIVNCCADMHGENEDRLVIKGCRTVLPGNARYCYKCGNESTYYQKGWLKDWRSENTRKAIENITVTAAVDFDEVKERNRTLG